MAELLDLGGLHRAVEAQTARTPEAVAVVGASAQLTYGELNRRANRLAHHLVARGVGLETLVGVYLERSLDMVVGLLGILKAGGAYVPLDPSYPSERLAWMLADSRARLVLTRQRQPEWLRGSDPEVIAVQADADEIAQEADGNLEVEVSPNHLAYVIYTSGSTGRPKGVLGLHRGVLSRLAGEFLPFAEGEVCCLKTPLNFVDSLWEVFAPLAWGLRTVLVEERELKEPRRLIRTLAHHRVTRLMLVPSLLQAILEASDDLPRQLPDLKYWYCGGELLTERLCDRFHAAMPAATLINGYGLSEVWDVTWYDTGRGKCPSRVPVGRPLRHVEVLLLDARGQPVPQGAAGEVYIGGAGLARGYLNRPDLTADRFVPHPFSPQPGARLYRSGDLARWRPDGDLEFIGRQDHQVKVRGYRIEPAEIQLALEAHPRVRQAAVRADEDQQGQPRLVAYVAGHKLVRASATRASPMPGADTTAGPVLSEGELRQFLRQRLPAHLVPDLFVVMDELPLTPNGKVDGLSLVAASRAKSDPTAGADRVRTETGTWLLETCRRLFAPVPVGFRDQFAALGMHSLLAMRLASQISRRFQVEVPAARILSIETVEALAQEIVAATQSPPNTACSGPKPIVRQGPLPASYAQRRLWFLERLVPG
ncbi:MAG TPA: amino acid adenylation domain-containing protein, partial [Verrucomicrobiota bacterium]|nr:amino acid adenylation domain-containing protein [Verrucomicrobiota bacterium]HNU52293.1 amino acid adenylation domain-containing protein [Verrucomicrobiota bacterium]